MYNKKTIISWAAVFLWMFLIFSFSAQPGKQSNELSKNAAVIIMETEGHQVAKITNPIAMVSDSFNLMVRKSSHFLGYLVLGILVINAAIRSKKSFTWAYWLSPIICILYAASDEFHQKFVSGRSPLVRDVMIDSAGAIVGIGLYLIINRMLVRRKSSELQMLENSTIN